MSAVSMASGNGSIQFSPESPQIPTQLSLSSKAFKENTGHRAQANRRGGLDRASRTASEEQMTPSVTRGMPQAAMLTAQTARYALPNAVPGTRVQGMACWRWREHVRRPTGPSRKSHRIRALSVP